MQLQTLPDKNRRVIKHKQPRQKKDIEVSQPHNYVIEDHGIMIKEQHKLITFEDFNIISILLALDNPLDAATVQIPAQCRAELKTHDILNNLKTHQDDIKKEVTSTVRAAIDINDEALSFLPPCTQNKRNCSLGRKHSIKENKKRFLGVLDTVLSIVGLARSAHNSKNIALITNHINMIDGEINEIAKVTEATVKLEKYDMTFHKNLIRILHKSRLELQVALTKVDCHIQTLRYEYTMLQAIQTWAKKIDNILTYQKTGKIEGKLTPGIIPIDLLKIIVNQHQSFTNTIYTEQPEMLYQQAHINFISMTSTLDKFHFTLIYPILQQPNIVPFFQLHQVGFKLKDATTCSKYLAPDYLTMKNGTFYDTRLDMCTTTPGLTICDMAYTEPALEACVGLKSVTCQPTEIPCRNNSFIFDDTGVLIYTETPIQIVKRKPQQQHTTTLKLDLLPKNEKSNTYFVTWKQSTKIYLTGRIIESPKIIPNNSIYHIPFYFSKNFNDTVFKAFSDMNTSQLTHGLKQQQNILNSMNENFHKIPPLLLTEGHLSIYAILAIVAGIIVTILVIILAGYCFYRRRLGMLTGMHAMAKGRETEHTTAKNFISYIYRDLPRIPEENEEVTTTIEEQKPTPSRNIVMTPTRVMYYPCNSGV